MIHVILVEPEQPGNIGAVARVMKNFGFTSLTLVNPKCEIDQEARNRAKHAQDVLENATIIKKIPHLHTLIATTAMLGTDYNIPRSPLTPEQCAELITNKNIDIGLIFGNEGSGLSNEQISSCDFVLTIPSSKSYPTLNLSQSVAIILYELSKKTLKTNITNHFVLASKKDKDQIMKLLEQTLQKQEYATEEKRDTQRKVWRRMIGKSFLTKREAMALMGFLKK